MAHFERLRTCAQQMKKDIGSFNNSGNVFQREPDAEGNSAVLTITPCGTIHATVQANTPTGIETRLGWFYTSDAASTKRLVRQIAV